MEPLDTALSISDALKVDSKVNDVPDSYGYGGSSSDDGIGTGCCILLPNPLFGSI